MDNFLDFIVLIMENDLSCDAHFSRFFFLSEFFKRIPIKSYLESNSLPKEYLFYFLDQSKNLKELKDKKESVLKYENNAFVIKKERITSEYLIRTRFLIKVMQDLKIKYEVQKKEKEKENLMHLSVASISSIFFIILFKILDGLEKLSYIYYKLNIRSSAVPFLQVGEIHQIRYKEEKDKEFQHIKKTIELWLSNTDTIQKIDDINCLLKLKNIKHLTKDFVLTELDLKLLKMNTLN